MGTSTTGTRGRLARIGLRPTLVLAVVLMLLWVVAYWRMSPMDGALFQPSRAGLNALVLYLWGDYGAAGRAYREGLRGTVWLEPGEDEAGYDALRSGDLVEAERRARATLAKDPSEPEARVTVAEVAIARGDPAAAAAQLGEVLARDPDHLDALLLSALVAARQGAAGQAIDALNRALRQGAGGERDTILFRLMEAAGDLAREPDGTRPLCLLAHLHRYLRIYDDRHAEAAMAYARGAVTAGDRPADAYLTIGILHDRRDEHDAALHALMRAVAINPRHAQAQWWAAGEARRIGDLLLEYRMMRGAFEAAPTDPFYLAPLVDLLLKRLGDAHGLIALLEKTVALDPRSGGAHEGLARAYQALGDRERAAAHEARARALRPAEAPTR